VQYQWYADGVLIEGATAASLSLTELHGNKKISVKASYIDGFGTAESGQFGCDCRRGASQSSGQWHCEYLA